MNEFHANSLPLVSQTYSNREDQENLTGKQQRLSASHLTVIVGVLFIKHCKLSWKCCCLLAGMCHFSCGLCSNTWCFDVLCAHNGSTAQHTYTSLHSLHQSRLIHLLPCGCCKTSHTLNQGQSLNTSPCCVIVESASHPCSLFPVLWWMQNDHFLHFFPYCLDT